jgi:3-dehydroquinate synthetase
VAILLNTGFTNHDFDEQATLLSALWLPIRIPSDLDIEKLVEIMQWDKKNTVWKINFTLPSSIWSMANFDWKWVAPIDKWMIREVLKGLQSKS